MISHLLFKIAAIAFSFLMIIGCSTEALSQGAEPDKVDFLTQLKSPDAATRIAVLERLNQKTIDVFRGWKIPNENEVVDTLISMISSDPEPKARSGAVSLLALLDFKGRIHSDVIIRAMDDKDFLVQSAAFEVMDRYNFVSKGDYYDRFYTAIRLVVQNPESPDEYRQHAVRSISLFDSPPFGAEELVVHEFQDDPSADVRAAAVGVIVFLDHKTGRYFDMVYAAFDDPSPVVRLAVLDGLFGYTLEGNQDIDGKLQKLDQIALRDPDPEIRVRVAMTPPFSLGKNRETIAALRSMATDPLPKVKFAGLYALSDKSKLDASFLPDINAYINDPYFEREGLRFLASLGEAGAPLIALVMDIIKAEPEDVDYTGIIYAAALKAGIREETVDEKFGPVEDGVLYTALKEQAPDSAIFRLLNDQRISGYNINSWEGYSYQLTMWGEDYPAVYFRIDPEKGLEVKVIATQTLGKIGNGPEVVALLDQLMDAGSGELKAAAVTALGDVGVDAVGSIPKMIRLIGSESPEVIDAAISAIASFGGAALPALNNALEGDDAHLAKNALRILLDEMPDTEGLDEKVIAFIGKFSIPEQIDTIDSEFYRSCLFVIGNGEARNPEIAPAIIRTLYSTDDPVREAAIYALMKTGIGGEDAIPGLILCLSAHQPSVRANAAIALGMLGGAASDALDTLDWMVQNDQNNDVRKAAGEAADKIRA